MPTTTSDPAEATRRWVVEVVVGLNLCPFARRVLDGGRIRFAITDATDPVALLAALADELRALVAAPREQVETTLLVHPHALLDYLDYNDFVAGDADRLVRRLGLRGVVQVVGFHPDYRFADAEADDPANFTNRSPYPMLHLLREASITEVAGDPDSLAAIPVRNVELLRRLGRDDMAARLKATTDPAG